MSTAKIKKALRHLRDNEAYGIGAADIRELADAALAEVEAIEKAAKAIDIATSGKPLTFSECDDADKAAELIRSIAKEAK